MANRMKGRLKHRFRRPFIKCYNDGLPLFFRRHPTMCKHHSHHTRDNDTIRIRGARTHNLKNVDLDIPRHKLVVVTSAKSIKLLMVKPSATTKTMLM